MKITTHLFFIFIFSTLCGAQTITTVVGTGTLGYSGDGGPATAAELNYTFGVAFDASGNMFIADNRNSVIREVNHSTGIISTVAGNSVQGYTGNGGPATAAEIYNPQGIAFDASDNYYFGSYGNVVQMVNTSGIISTVAGNYAYGAGYSGDGGIATAAELNNPTGVTFDASGNLYIADYQNNIIREVNHSTGIINTVAGNQPAGFGYTGDGGPATAAEFHGIEGVAIDASGNMYVTDAGNSAVRKVNTSGIVNTVIGGNGPGYSGDCGQASAAKLGAPTTVFFDNAGNLYITDGGPYGRGGDVVIRKVVISTGIISTVAGNYAEGQGYSGDGGPATAAELNQPYGVAFDAADNMYISDCNNNVIRKVGSSTVGIDELKSTAGVNVFPNPSNGIFELGIRNYELGMNYNIEVYNVLGEKVYSQAFSINNSQFTIDLQSKPEGIYLYRVIANTGKIIGEGKLVIQK